MGLQRMMRPNAGVRQLPDSTFVNIQSASRQVTAKKFPNDEEYTSNLALPCTVS